MSEKTLVLDIQELYQVIPECKALEGQNFKDIKELLLNLVAAIEKTGTWEFIQYVNNKPSLFVIRRVQSTTNSQFESKKFREFESMYRDVKNIARAARSGQEYASDPYEGGGYLESDIPEAAPIGDMGEPEEVLKNDVMEETEKEVERNLNDTYVPSVKLPWE